MNILGSAEAVCLVVLYAAMPGDLFDVFAVAPLNPIYLLIFFMLKDDLCLLYGSSCEPYLMSRTCPEIRTNCRIGRPLGLGFFRGRGMRREMGLIGGVEVGWGSGVANSGGVGQAGQVAVPQVVETLCR